MLNAANRAKNDFAIGIIYLNRNCLLLRYSMWKQILAALFSTFVFSSVIAVGVLRISYAINENFVRAGLDMSFDGSLPSSLILVNVILFVACLPAFLLVIPGIYDNIFTRLSSWFIGPITLLSYVTWFNLTMGDIFFWIFIGGAIIIYIIVYSIFYVRFKPKNYTIEQLI